MVNLLNNAKDALKENMELKKKYVFISAFVDENSNSIILTVKDNGGGIPDDILENVFDAYFTTKSSSNGTGLGLYITHSIITQNFKGSIKVQNEEYEYDSSSHKGAKFTITLPLTDSL